MKRTLFGSIALALAVAALVWYPGGQRADAQTSITRTTLSSAVTATATSVIVASATGLAANSFLYIDGELMQIQSVSSTTATVRRNVSGGASGNAIAHAANSVATSDRLRGAFDINPYGGARAAPPSMAACVAAPKFVIPERAATAVRRRRARRDTNRRTGAG